LVLEYRGNPQPSTLYEVYDAEALDETFRNHAKIFRDIPAASGGIEMVKDFLGQSDLTLANSMSTISSTCIFVDRLKRELPCK
jgi:hypothetical protein